MPLFWKVYAFSVILLIIVVGMAEFVLEPVGEALLAGVYGGYQPWHEAVVWAGCILVVSLAYGYILSKVLETKLDKLVRAAGELAAGNLEARLPATDNDRDAFDVLSRRFNEMAAAVERQLYHERRLLADISHELRSPLARMAVATELLRRRRDQGERAALLLRMEKEVAHMNGLVEHLLFQARERLSPEGSMEPVDLPRLLDELADDCNFQARERDVLVKTRCDHGLSVRGNAALLRRALGNLLSNAVFYSPAGSRVDVDARRLDNGVALTVRDFGPGVPEDQLEDIFRAFYRVDASRTRSSGGAGLGLALAREAVIVHGGSIRAANARPGLAITVILPGWTGSEDTANS